MPCFAACSRPSAVSCRAPTVRWVSPNQWGQRAVILLAPSPLSSGHARWEGEGASAEWQWRRWAVFADGGEVQPVAVVVEDDVLQVLDADDDRDLPGILQRKKRDKG